MAGLLARIPSTLEEGVGEVLVANTSHLRKFASQTRQMRKLKLMAFPSAIES